MKMNPIYIQRLICHKKLYSNIEIYLILIIFKIKAIINVILLRCENKKSNSKNAKRDD